MATANEMFLDLLVRHQVGLQRLSAGLRKDILRLLDATEADLANQILRRTAAMTPGQVTPANLRRLQNLETVVRNIRRGARDSTFKLWNTEMRALVRAEPEFVATSLAGSSPVVWDTVIPPASQLTSLVATNPFEGKVLKGWADDIHRADVDRIMAQVQMGMVQGDTPREMARRVVGTARLRGTDGVTEITRRQATAVTRTAVNHYSNQAKRVFYEANSDIFSEEQYLATLDGRTTPICRSLDGRRFPVGEGPRPPLHFQCRSLRVAVINGQVAGTRPATTATEKQLVREFAKERNLGRFSRRADLPRGTKGDYDRFARVRKRELTGRVPASENYQTWLRKQPREFQEEVLGVKKAKLFREGGLTLDKYVDKKGGELTLSQLQVKEGAAFRKAGIEVDSLVSTASPSVSRVVSDSSLRSALRGEAKLSPSSVRGDAESLIRKGRLEEARKLLGLDANGNVVPRGPTRVRGDFVADQTEKDQVLRMSGNLRREFEGVKEGLTKDETSHLRRYRSKQSLPLNRRIRDGDDLGDLAPMAETLDRLTSSRLLQYDTKAFTGMRLSLSPKDLVGRTISKKGFTSTSFSEKTARGHLLGTDKSRNQFLIDVDLKAKTRGWFLDEGAKNELEFVLPRDAKFIVREVIREEDRFAGEFWRLKVELVDG